MFSGVNTVPSLVKVNSKWFVWANCSRTFSAKLGWPSLLLITECSKPDDFEKKRIFLLAGAAVVGERVSQRMDDMRPKARAVRRNAFMPFLLGGARPPGNQIPVLRFG